MKRVGLMLTIAIVLVAIWFGPNKMLANADEGLPFYNAARTVHNYSSYIFDTGLGVSGSFNTPRLPLFWVASGLQKLGLDSIDVQKTVYLILLIVPLVVLPELVTELFGQKRTRASLIVALFYLFNLYSYSQVWTRFVMSLVFLWSYLPLFLLLWVKLIRTHKFRYLVYLIVSSFAYSTAFVIISPLLTLWICALIYLVIHILRSPTKLKDVIVAGLAILLWVISNLWWAYPMWRLRHSTHGSSINTAVNYLSLSQVSKFFPSSEVLTLRQKFMIGPQRPNFDFYNQKKVYLLSWAALGIAVVGVVTSTSNLGKSYFLSMFVIGWFISKGTNPPFGEQFFSYIFSKFSLSQVYRNSYEKFGSVLVLAYAVFFGIGLSWMSGRLGKLGRLGGVLTLLIICGYMLTPFWSGESINKLAGVTVPNSYLQANLYIQNRNSSGERILQLPLLRGQLIYYKWNYVGEEPSEFLFDNASVSRTLTNKTVDELYLKLGEPDLFRNNPNFANILATMNISQIVLHDDVIITPYYQENSAETREHIKRWKGVNIGAKFDDLEVYEIDVGKIPGRLYVSDSLTMVDSLDQALDRMVTSNFDSKREVVVIKSQNENLKLNYPTLGLPIYNVDEIKTNFYRMEVIDSQQPFLLVLANNFDKSWEARIDKRVLSERLIVNGYANAWVVDKKGTYFIDVVYPVWPWE